MLPFRFTSFHYLLSFNLIGRKEIGNRDGVHAFRLKSNNKITSDHKEDSENETEIMRNILGIECD
jgi:hypothetical protein